MEIEASQGAPPGNGSSLLRVHWMKPASVSILAAIRSFRSVNAATVAATIRAATTAYSDSSSPVSSLKNFINMTIFWLDGSGTLECAVSNQQR